jgi:hypothetical protein
MDLKIYTRRMSEREEIRLVPAGREPFAQKTLDAGDLDKNTGSPSANHGWRANVCSRQRLQAPGSPWQQMKDFHPVRATGDGYFF